MIFFHSTFSVVKGKK
uniref:Uncharacterized protein n=1 Tax=Arundo donax TaxID=35708 RepID=A0A0A9FS43_ARUDO